MALVRKLQSQLMYLGLESLYQDQPTEREFGTLTLSLTKSEFEEIKFKLRQMRKALHKDNSIARMKDKGERVYQLNIQLFPVTNAVESAVKAPAMKSALDIQVETPIVETTPVEAPVMMAEAAPVVPQAAAPTTPVSAKEQKNERSNVSSLAATAASAADLFR
ncbi:TIGR02147 family protein [Bdellovibrio bacteriovorus]|uniref:TIGR02147 family protein n=1 Tax=Bdellovibrio bacteriovorus TaxID=959 RepID=UPI0035A5C704